MKRVRASGTRVDRVAKTTGSQVIIKCNQYFTYFSRKLEGCFPWIPYKFPRGLLPFLPFHTAADVAQHAHANNYKRRGFLLAN